MQFPLGSADDCDRTLFAWVGCGRIPPRALFSPYRHLFPLLKVHVSEAELEGYRETLVRLGRGVVARARKSCRSGLDSRARSYLDVRQLGKDWPRVVVLRTGTVPPTASRPVSRRLAQAISRGRDFKGGSEGVVAGPGFFSKPVDRVLRDMRVTPPEANVVVPSKL